MVLGTPPYMSPEQFTGQPVDERSDIYALGVMTYEMLVGKYPFEANTAWEWASKHMTEPPRPIETQPLGPNVPERMRTAITRALAKNKDERFSTVKEFFEAFSGSASSSAVAPAPAHEPPLGAGAAAVSAGHRAKTEMGEPMMGGGPPGGFPPPAYGGSPGSGLLGAPSTAAASAASVPRGPAHAQPKKGNGLVIGLAVLAVLLLVGGAAALALRGGGKKPVPTTELPVGTVTTPVETASATPPEEVDAAFVAANPLGGPVSTGVKTAVTGAGATGAKTTTPKPVPTPVIKTDPPICATARAARKRNSPAAASLEQQCRAAGGTP
jgi:serine/threonine-protein kinase